MHALQRLRLALLIGVAHAGVLGVVDWRPTMSHTFWMKGGSGDSSKVRDRDG
jgi:hypothetical protein